MDLLQKMDEIRPVMDQPIGKAGLMAVGLGATGGVTRGLAKVLNLDPTYASLILAFLVKLEAVEDMLGKDLSELISVSAWVNAFNLFPQIQLQSKTEESVASLLGADKTWWQTIKEKIGLGYTEPMLIQSEENGPEPGIGAVVPLNSLDSKLGGITLQ